MKMQIVLLLVATLTTSCHCVLSLYPEIEARYYTERGFNSTEIRSAAFGAEDSFIVLGDLQVGKNSTMHRKTKRAFGFLLNPKFNKVKIVLQTGDFFCDGKKDIVDCKTLQSTNRLDENKPHDVIVFERYFNKDELNRLRMMIYPTYGNHDQRAFHGSKGLADCEHSGFGQCFYLYNMDRFYDYFKIYSPEKNRSLIRSDVPIGSMLRSSVNGMRTSDKKEAVTFSYAFDAILNSQSIRFIALARTDLFYRPYDRDNEGKATCLNSMTSKGSPAFDASNCVIKHDEKAVSQWIGKADGIIVIDFQEGILDGVEYIDRWLKTIPGHDKVKLVFTGDTHKSGVYSKFNKILPVPKGQILYYNAGGIGHAHYATDNLVFAKVFQNGITLYDVDVDSLDKPDGVLKVTTRVTKQF